MGHVFCLTLRLYCVNLLKRLRISFAIIPMQQKQWTHLYLIEKIRDCDQSTRRALYTKFSE